MSNEVLDYLESHSYDDTATRFGISRGKIWAMAVEAKRRKNESRIQERNNERKRRQQEFLQEVLNRSMKSDVLDFMDGLPDKSVSFHVTSVPYNLGKRYGGSDTIDRKPFTYYLGWLLQILSEFNRTLVEGGVLFLQVGQTKDDLDELYPLDTLLFPYLRGMGMTFQSRIVWEQPHGLTPKYRLAERYETALVFSKGPACRVFNASAGRTPQIGYKKRAYKGPNKGKLSCHPQGSHPTNVWRIPSVGHCHPDKKFTGDHPAPFPSFLAYKAIMLYTLPGDLVCDVFGGSGTVYSESKRTGRMFTGCDLFYDQVQANRIASVEPETFFKFPGVTEESAAIWEAEARAINFEPSVLISKKKNEKMLLDLFDFEGEMESAA